MAGGILNLVAYGDQNIILNGNPTRSFFKSTYSKYTNFGMQKFRIDQIGNKELQLSKPTKFTFKILRLGDLLMDTYLCVNLPNIWSPIIKHDIDGSYRPYEFRWIKNIGTQIIKEVTFTIGGHIIQQFSGIYLQNMVERDFTITKKQLFDKMIGNQDRLTNPAKYNNGNYPNAFNPNNSDISGIIPSIDEYQLVIPLNTWFSLMSKMAFPLVCLQYNELVIDFEFRPVYELYTVNDVDYKTSQLNSLNDVKRIRPDESKDYYEFRRFINPPPQRDIRIDSNSQYSELPIKNHNYNVHLMCNYCFLDNEEMRLFSQNEQKYLIKTIHEKNYEIKNQFGGKIVIETNGLVANWMWYLQRNDIKDNNEWSNYTNYKYENIPPNSLKHIDISINSGDGNAYYNLKKYNPDTGIDVSLNMYSTRYIPDRYSDSNILSILDKFAIICDGKYREDDLIVDMYNYAEKYTRTCGNAKNGLFCYNFGVTNDPFSQQPTGSFNTNLFRTIEFEYKLKKRSTGEPLASYDSSGINVQFVCDEDTDIVIQVKDATNVHKYSFNFYLMEERYNVLLFNSGYADLVYNR